MGDLTSQEIFNDILPGKLEDNDEIGDIDAIYEFDVSGDNGGTWVIDFTKDENFISEGSSEDSDCTIEVSDSDFVGMWNGDLSGQQLFMMGKISVDGDMGLALKLQKFIG